uniref:U1764ae n=1 Tax=Mycobacterium leprae TaxID=1769 RepID=Q50015_MYCLR|nr:u1764ae [Mycobacterium leprae]
MSCQHKRLIVGRVQGESPSLQHRPVLRNLELCHHVTLRSPASAAAAMARLAWFWTVRLSYNRTHILVQYLGHVLRPIVVNFGLIHHNKTSGPALPALLGRSPI